MSLRKYVAHYRDNLKLAIPVVISQAGQTLTNVADNVMIGHYNTLSLSAAAFVNSVFVIFLVLGIGFSIGLTPLVGQAFGQQKYEDTGHLLKHSLLLNVVLSLIVLIILNNSTPLLYHLGQEAEVVTTGITYFKVLNWSMLPIMVFFTFKQFAEGVSSTKPAMVMTLISNGLNVFLNYLLIYGNWGFPELGLDGAGYATLTARIAMALGMAYYTMSSKRFRAFLNTFFDLSYVWSTFKSILKISFPISMQFVMEVAAFAIGAIMVGKIGKTEIAAHQIAIGMASVTFMIASGVASAVTIRTSNQLGAGKIGEARLLTWSALHIIILFMCMTSVVFMLGNRLIPSLHTPDEAVIRIAAPMMIVAAFFQLVDGIQVVTFGALRGISDVKIPTIIAFFAYWVIALPAGYIMAFYLGFNELGIWYGFLLGLSTAAILLTIRFHFATRGKQKNLIAS
ncbi:MATE family efflux transporter [Limibacter armeniacum]|uniref:MATE family efflux transporter n=1 Tax=Limibacter armeniacum TaxID=466084 RepID=UPI002FE66F2B